MNKIIPQEKVKPEDCRHWDYCSAPICPLDKVKNLNYLWYPEEEICRLKLKDIPNWVRVQRKIIKKNPDINKYFTFEMLNRNFIVKNGIVGLDPDKDEKPQLKKWLKSHPPKRQISEEEKKVISLRFRGHQTGKKSKF